MDPMDNPNGAVQNVDELSDTESVSTCGSRNCSIALYSAPLFLVVLCMFVFISNCFVYGLYPSVATTLQKRYGLSSLAIGSLQVVYSLVVLLGSPVLAYFAGFGNKIRWLASAQVALSLGVLIFALPQFLSPAFQISSSGGVRHWQLCGEALKCGDMNSETSIYGWLVLAMVLAGGASSVLGTVGPAFIEGNVEKPRVPIYLGYFYTMTAFAPAIGYVVSGYFLNEWVDGTAPPGVTPSNAEFVGNWWISFLILGAIGLAFSIPMGMFPESLPIPEATSPDSVDADSENQSPKSGRGGSASPDEPVERKPTEPNSDSNVECVNSETAAVSPTDDDEKYATETTVLANSDRDTVEMTRRSNVVSPDTIKSDDNDCANRNDLEWNSLDELWHVISYLMSHRVFMLISLVTCSGAAGGTLLGGYLITRLNSIRAILKFCLGCTVAACLLFLPLINTCDTTRVGGIIVSLSNQYAYHSNIVGNGSLTLILETARENIGFNGALLGLCNAGCTCNNNPYAPICDPRSGVSYFNPCFAGCLSTTPYNAPVALTSFSNCTCIPAYNSSDGVILSGSSSMLGGTATGGLCNNSNCSSTMYIWMTLMFLVLLATFLINVPATAMLLKLLPEKDRAFGLGIQNAVLGVGATIAPAIFGVVIDRSCLLFESTCSSNIASSCVLYSSDQLRITVVLLGVLTKLVSISFLIAAIYFQPDTSFAESQIVPPPRKDPGAVA